MIIFTWSDQFRNDVKNLLDQAYDEAFKKDQSPIDAQKHLSDTIKNELSKIGVYIQANPLSYPKYNERNPTRRAIIANGTYILEYQVIPQDARFGHEVREVIITSLVIARSIKHQKKLDEINFEDL